MSFWHCSFSCGRCVVTLFGKCLCFACQCAHQVLGKGRHKSLSQCFSTFLKKLSSSCMHKYFSCKNLLYRNRICEAQKNFPYVVCLDFFSALFQRGRNAKEFVCLYVYESVTEWMFYSSPRFQTGDIAAPSRHDSGESVQLSKYSGVSY